MSLSNELLSIGIAPVPMDLDFNLRSFLESFVNHVRVVEGQLTAKRLESAFRDELDKFLVPVPPDREKDFILVHDEAEIDSSPGTPVELMKAVKWKETTGETPLTTEQRDSILYYQILQISGVT